MPLVFLQFLIHTIPSMSVLLLFPSFFLFSSWKLLSIVDNKGHVSYVIGKALIELQEKMSKLSQEVAQVREFTPRNPYRQGRSVSPMNIEYSSSHADFDDEESRARRRRHPRDDLRDLKVESPKFDNNLNLEKYLDLVQVLKRIF